VILQDIQGEGTITLYDVLWNHADKNRKAGELIEDLSEGLRLLSANKSKLKRYETIVKKEPTMKDGHMVIQKLPREKWYKWGSLEDTDKYGRRFGLIPFVEEILILCIKHPDARVIWSR
jgi:hypothetical protein